MNDGNHEGNAGVVGVATPRLVDARWLEPPEPMERVLAALDALPPGHGLRFLIHREPLPLYGLLQHRGYRHRVQRLEDGCFEVFVEAITAPDTGNRHG